jgi:hypothetical protein
MLPEAPAAAPVYASMAKRSRTHLRLVASAGPVRKPRDEALSSHAPR